MPIVGHNTSKITMLLKDLKRPKVKSLHLFFTNKKTKMFMEEEKTINLSLSNR